MFSPVTVRYGRGASGPVRVVGRHRGAAATDAQRGEHDVPASGRTVEISDALGRERGGEQGVGHGRLP